MGQLACLGHGPESIIILLAEKPRLLKGQGTPGNHQH